MSMDRAVDALAQCLPMLFRKYGNGALKQDGGGYFRLAEALDRALSKRGFRIISHQTYDRMRNAEDKYLRGLVHANQRLETGDRGRQGSDLLQPVLEG